MTVVITSGPKYADFVLYEDGTFTIEAIGFTGKQCKDFTEPFERALAPLRRVDYAVAGPLKVPTLRARMRRPIVQIAEQSERPAPAAVAEVMRRVILPAVADLVLEGEEEAPA